VEKEDGRRLPAELATQAEEVHARARNTIPAERVRAEIDELFASEQDLGEVLEEVARLSVRLVIQAAVEAEVTEFLGRDRYARGERERAGHRNGHAELTVKTTAGPVVLARPKLRGTDQPFTSRLLGKGVSRTNALEALVLSGFVRGLSAATWRQPWPRR
jgi:putative transposase